MQREALFLQIATCKIKIGKPKIWIYELMIDGVRTRAD
jgi:hypothetical protein